MRAQILGSLWGSQEAPGAHGGPGRLCMTWPRGVGVDAPWMRGPPGWVCEGQVTVSTWNSPAGAQIGLSLPQVPPYHTSC